MRSDPVIKEHFITDTQKRFEVIQLVEDAEPSVENLYNKMMASINETAEACIPKCAISKRRATWEDDTVEEKRHELRKALHKRSSDST